MKIEKLTSMPIAQYKSEGTKKNKRDNVKTLTEDAVTMEGDRKRKSSSEEENSTELGGSEEEVLAESAEQIKNASSSLDVIV